MSWRRPWRSASRRALERDGPEEGRPPVQGIFSSLRRQAPTPIYGRRDGQAVLEREPDFGRDSRGHVGRRRKDSRAPQHVADVIQATGRPDPRGRVGRPASPDVFGRAHALNLLRVVFMRASLHAARASSAQTTVPASIRLALRSSSHPPSTSDSEDMAGSASAGAATGPLSGSSTCPRPQIRGPFRAAQVWACASQPFRAVCGSILAREGQDADRRLRSSEGLLL